MKFQEPQTMEYSKDGEQNPSQDGGWGDGLGMEEQGLVLRRGKGHSPRGKKKFHTMAEVLDETVAC